MAKSPLALVKDQFGDKSKLVEAVQKIAADDLWLGRTNEDKGLAHVSNAKLLRLHATFTAVKAKFGSRAKLIDAVLDAEKRTKDAGYKTRLEAFPVPRLWDMFRSAEKRNGVKSADKTAKKPAAKKAAATEAPAKKVAAKKTAAKAPAAKKTAKKSAK